MHRLPARRRDAHPHARRNNQRVFTILLQFQFHPPPLKHPEASYTTEKMRSEESESLPSADRTYFAGSISRTALLNAPFNGTFNPRFASASPLNVPNNFGLSPTW